MANDFAVVSSVNTRFLLGPCIGVFELIANLRKRQHTRSVRMLPADRQTAVASGRDTRNEEVDEMTTDTQVTWLTQEAYDRLKAELDQLIANRPVIAAEINDRREEGDLRENGGYHAAREEQGQQEARIRSLQDLLNNAKVGEAPKQSGVALPGSVVKVYYNGDKSDTETFLIATRQEG